MNTTNCKIAEQSKDSFTKALLHIMKQYDYKEITVTQIAGEAQLSRKTFYRLFSNKDEVLDHLFKKMITSFFYQINKKQVEHYWEVVQLYFDFWQTKKSLLLLLKKNNLLFLLYEISYHHSFDAFRLVRTEKTASAYSETLPYLLAYSIGGMHCMLIKWVEDDMKLPSKLFVQQLREGLQSFEL